MCRYCCEGLGNHLVLSGEGWGFTVPGFAIGFLFFFSWFIGHAYLSFKGPYNTFETMNAGSLNTPLTLPF